MIKTTVRAVQAGLCAGAAVCVAGCLLPLSLHSRLKPLLIEAGALTVAVAVAASPLLIGYREEE